MSYSTTLTWGRPRFRSHHEPTHVCSTFPVWRRDKWSEAQNDTFLLRTGQLVPSKAWQGHVQRRPVSSGYLYYHIRPEANSRRRRDCLPSSFRPTTSSSSTAAGKNIAPSVLTVWGLIQDVEIKASKLSSCSWIFVLSNEHGHAGPNVAM